MASSSRFRSKWSILRAAIGAGLSNPGCDEKDNERQEPIDKTLANIAFTLTTLNLILYPQESFPRVKHANFESSILEGASCVPRNLKLVLFGEDWDLLHVIEQNIPMSIPRQSELDLHLLKDSLPFSGGDELT